MADVTDLTMFECVASDDPVKTDLELTCLTCGDVICDVEAGDTLGTLVDVAEGHLDRVKKEGRPHA